MNFFSLKTVEDRINKNYFCLKELEQLVAIQSTLDEKLEVISLIGKMYAEYITGIYASDALEKQVVESSPNIEYSLSDKSNEKHILIVMSECGEIGGHTALVHN